MLSSPGVGRKPFLLSSELSKACALLAGGVPAPAALALIREWELRAPARGVNRAPPALRLWSGRLTAAIQEAIPLGAPVSSILRAVLPMIRADERQWARLRSIEGQFAFQGALAAVLPWTAAALTEAVHLNGLTLAGAGLQAAGLAGFALVLRAAVRVPRDEAARAFELASGAWMRVLAGLSLRSGLEGSLVEQPADPFRSAWGRWLAAYEGGAALETFDWPEGFEASRELALLFSPLLRTGAPAAAALSDVISRLGDDRQAEADDRLARLPSRISLLFCATLAPGFFLILTGGLWPMLEGLLT